MLNERARVAGAVGGTASARGGVPVAEVAWGEASQVEGSRRHSDVRVALGGSAGADQRLQGGKPDDSRGDEHGLEQRATGHCVGSDKTDHGNPFHLHTCSLAHGPQATLAAECGRGRLRGG